MRRALCAPTGSVRHHRALASPRAQGVDRLLPDDRQRPGRPQLVEEDVGGELDRARERRVEPGDDGLLDLGAGEALGGSGQPIEVEGGGTALPLLEVDGEDLLALRGGRQIDEEDLVEASRGGDRRCAWRGRRPRRSTASS